MRFDAILDSAPPAGGDEVCGLYRPEPLAKDFETLAIHVTYWDTILSNNVDDAAKQWCDSFLSIMEECIATSIPPAKETDLALVNIEY